MPTTITQLRSLKAKATNPTNFLYIGVDVHKDQHTAVAIDCFGKIVWQQEINNYLEDFEQLLSQIKEVAEVLGLKLIFGLEDGYGYGQRLAHYLYQNHMPVKIVSPVLVERGRKYQTHPEKSDSLDAFGVAKALIQRIGTLPDFSISKSSEIAREIKELIIDREFLVKEQTRLKNQLHRLLHRAYNSEYRKKFKNPFSKKAMDYWLKYPVPNKGEDISFDPALLRDQIKRKVKRLVDIKEEILELEQEAKVLVDQTDQKIETLNGCGLVLAATLLAEIKDIDRFNSADSLAKYAGLCPKEKSSGKRIRHIKTKSGNRRLNKTFHRIALSQIGKHGNEYSKEYFRKKITEGKSKVQALCCLKRRLANIVFMMLKHRQEYRYSSKKLT